MQNIKLKSHVGDYGILHSHDISKIKFKAIALIIDSFSMLNVPNVHLYIQVLHRLKT